MDIDSFFDKVINLSTMLSKTEKKYFFELKNDIILNKKIEICKELIEFETRSSARLKKY